MKEKITKIVSVCLIIQFLCISLLPITEVKAAHIDGRNYYRDEVEYWTYIGTSSKVMRDIMIDSVGYDTFVQKTKYLLLLRKQDRLFVKFHHNVVV